MRRNSAAAVVGVVATVAIAAAADSSLGSGNSGWANCLDSFGSTVADSCPIDCRCKRSVLGAVALADNSTAAGGCRIDLQRDKGTLSE